MRPIQAYIDFAALRANLARARQAAPKQRLLAVVKANAYGHGLVPVALALAGAGAEALAVASLEEAIQLREAGLALPVLLLEGFFEIQELPLIQTHRLHTVIHSPWQLEGLLRSKPTGRPIPVWLKFDSGMHRLGFEVGQLRDAWQRLQARPDLAAPLRLLTHLACADDCTNPQSLVQCRTFADASTGLVAERSIANSAGILAWPQSHADWGRPGIMLYGATPFNTGTGSELGLQPVMQLCSKLIAVHHYQRGDHIGYAATWQCPEDMPVGVVAAGYGDGYPRHAPAGTPVWIEDRAVPLIGRVSMDMLTVDLRPRPHSQVGDRVELWGRQISADTVAELAGTIAYDLFCGVTPRVPRLAGTLF